MIKYRIGRTFDEIHSAYIKIFSTLSSDRQILYPAFCPNAYKGFCEMKIFLNRIVKIEKI